MNRFIIFSTLITMSWNCAFATIIPPFDARWGRAEFVSSYIKEGDVGAEIGVDHGVFAYHVLLPTNPSKLYLIDPWILTEADVGWNPSIQVTVFRDELFFDVCDLFAPFDNIEIIREKSEDAIGYFPDEFLDYLYIDGEHSYDAVKCELANYFPKIKVGGYIIGNDYGWQGVDYAVQEFLEMHKDEVFWLDDPYNGNTAGQYLIQKIK